MTKIKQKLIDITKLKYFVPIFVMSLNVLLFVICNLFLKPSYETVDDFILVKIISALDGNYSIFSIYNHPFLSFFIMLLYKTGINVNIYTIVILLIQFISFTVIGISLINKNRRIGTIVYLIIMCIGYFPLLLIINYTSIAIICALAGVLVVIDHENSKKAILGFILIALGYMLRDKSIILVLPFYCVYAIYKIIKEKNYQGIKNLIIILIIISLLYASYLIIYNSNETYKNYTKFNKIRTYFFDFNIINYERNKDAFEENGWGYNEWNLLYSYSFADENFYTIDNLNSLKNSLKLDLNYYINKLANIMNKGTLIHTLYYFIFPFFVTLLLYFIGIKNTNKNKLLFLLYLFVFAALLFMLYYLRPGYRVIMPTFTIALALMFNILLTEKRENTDFKATDQVIWIIVLAFVFMSASINVILKNGENKKDYNYINDVLAYTSENKQNCYVYPNVLENISLAYSIYDKLDDGTFENLRHLGDWDVFDGLHFKFKEKNHLNNLLTDLYKTDNLYLIDGPVLRADFTYDYKHIDSIIDYLENRYNVTLSYKIIKEFDSSDIKIYKIYEK